MGLTGRGVALLMLVTAAASVLVVVGTMLAADEGAPVRAGAPTLEAGGGAAPTPTVVVEPGGSLWGVAVRHAPEDSDLRAYVADLEDANGVSAGEVRPGMVLRLPPR